MKNPSPLQAEKEIEKERVEVETSPMGTTCYFYLLDGGASQFFSNFELHM
jgi:hypothetical protein